MTLGGDLIIRHRADKKTKPNQVKCTIYSPDYLYYFLHIFLDECNNKYHMSSRQSAASFSGVHEASQSIICVGPERDVEEVMIK